MTLLRVPFLCALCCLAFLLDADTCIGQTKYERELRIQPNQVPPSAISYIDSLRSDPQKIKWYKEIRIEGHSYEAKFKFEKYKYSIEFDSTGVLEDVEKTIDWHEVSPDIQQAICDHLYAHYDIHKIRNIQLHYAGSSIRDLNSLEDLSDIAAYELVIDVRKDGVRSTRQISFGVNGSLISTFTIINRLSDNMEF